MTPRAASERIGPLRDGALVVRVTAAPVEGAANDALVRLLAEALGLPRSAVAIEAGRRSRRKIVSVPAAAAARLRGLAEGT